MSHGVIGTQPPTAGGGGSRAASEQVNVKFDYLYFPAHHLTPEQERRNIELLDLMLERFYARVQQRLADPNSDGNDD